MGAADTAFQKVDIYGTEEGPALLDRLLDHVETVVIEGKSYRGQSHAEA
jgi:hypothetical protein